VHVREGPYSIHSVCLSGERACRLHTGKDTSVHWDGPASARGAPSFDSDHLGYSLRLGQLDRHAVWVLFLLRAVLDLTFWNDCKINTHNPWKKNMPPVAESFATSAKLFGRSSRH